jgi:hypothetical protein
MQLRASSFTAQEQLMRSKSVLSLALSAIAASVVFFASDDASAQEPERESVAMSANRGLHIGIAPTLVFPMREGGPYGGGLELGARYGIKAGPTVVAPGGALGGYAISGRFVGLAMPTLRWTIPVGPLAPYALGGVGVGGLSNPGESGLALLGGGGLMIHFGHIFAVGAELTYRTITGTEYSGLALGPIISFGG